MKIICCKKYIYCL